MTEQEDFEFKTLFNSVGKNALAPMEEKQMDENHGKDECKSCIIHVQVEWCKLAGSVILRLVAL